MINEKMRLLGAKRSVIRELFEYGRIKKAEIGEENIFDFSLGNPSVPAPSELSENITQLVRNENPVTLHGYTSAAGDFEVRRAIAEHISNNEGIVVSADCLYLTVGAAASLTSTFGAILNPGEEIIIPAPYFPEYKVFAEHAGAKVREVMCTPNNFMLDVAAIEKAINESTAAIIINSPNNPTGAVYPEENLVALCEVLREKEKEFSHPIYLISDEPYRELVYCDKKPPYIPKLYDNSIICYSYSKVLSIPGERIGYVLVSPRMDNFDSVYQAISGAARALGYVCAPSLLQKLIPTLLGKMADISIYDKNRKLLLTALTEYGYEVVRPDGAFYLFVKALEEDSIKFSENAKRFNLLLVPSDDFGCKGYVRIAYCVDTERIIRALPAFKALKKLYEE